MAERTLKTNTPADEMTQEEKEELKRQELEFMKKDIEFLKVKCEREELIARIEVALRNQIAASRERIYMISEMKQAAEQKEEKKE
jgi:hypothetical protein